MAKRWFYPEIRSCKSILRESNQSRSRVPVCTRRLSYAGEASSNVLFSSQKNSSGKSCIADPRIFSASLTGSKNRQKGGNRHRSRLKTQMANMRRTKMISPQRLARRGKLLLQQPRPNLQPSRPSSSHQRTNAL